MTPARKYEGDLKERKRISVSLWQKRNPWRRGYDNANTRCRCNKYYKHVEMRLCVEDVKKLWFQDKAYNLKKPSLDRINPKGNYEHGNCRYIEWIDNVGSKRINKIQDGVVIETYYSIREAARKTGIHLQNISSAANGKHKKSGGFQWKFAV